MRELDYATFVLWTTIMPLDYYKLVDLSPMLFVWTYVVYVVLVNCYVAHI